MISSKLRDMVFCDIDKLNRELVTTNDKIVVGDCTRSRIYFDIVSFRNITHNGYFYVSDDSLQCSINTVDFQDAYLCSFIDNELTELCDKYNRLKEMNI